MKRSLLAGALLLASHALLAQQFDFDYAINGDPQSRPSLVFNDGANTYVQPRQGTSLTVAGAVRSGPYWMVAGLPEQIRATGAGAKSDVLISRVTKPVATTASAKPASQSAGDRGSAPLRPPMVVLPAGVSLKQSVRAVLLLRGYSFDVSSDTPDFIPSQQLAFTDGRQFKAQLAKVFEAANWYAAWVEADKKIVVSPKLKSLMD
jgi:hypothetical protein